MSNNLPVLSIAFVTGEEIEKAGLPTLKVYESRNSYILVDEEEAIKSALIESLRHSSESNHTVLFLAVEIISVEERARKGGAA